MNHAGRSRKGAARRFTVENEPLKPLPSTTQERKHYQNEHESHFDERGNHNPRYRWSLDQLRPVTSRLAATRAGSQSFPSPAATAAEDGSTTIWFSPEQPDGVDRGNWIQTNPEKGWFTILRLYSPLPSFFDKSWRPSEIAWVK